MFLSNLKLEIYSSKKVVIFVANFVNTIPLYVIPLYVF